MINPYKDKELISFIFELFDRKIPEYKIHSILIQDGWSSESAVAFVDWVNHNLKSNELIKMCKSEDFQNGYTLEFLEAYVARKLHSGFSSFRLHNELTKRGLAEETAVYLVGEVENIEYGGDLNEDDQEKLIDSYFNQMVLGAGCFIVGIILTIFTLSNASSPVIFIFYGAILAGPALFFKGFIGWSKSKQISEQTKSNVNKES